ncbi:aspartyl protease family protein [Pendulispora rubella]|uniref:Aspartyl protease family protein n=1 Tax=Pendulispora rubella TaxID=2741070 RepID=A0ABZ2L4K7_9BACT
MKRTLSLPFTLFLLACGSSSPEPAGPSAAPPAASISTPAPVAADDAMALVHRMKTATGAERWDDVRALHAKGDAVFDGVKGTFTLDEDLQGRFALRAAHEVFVVGEGFDGKQRWRQDAGGQPHALDTAEAKAIAVSEVYLASRRYLFPDRFNAQFRRSQFEEDGRSWEKLEVTPEGGRTITMRIDPKSYLVDRTSMHLSFHPRVTKYADYRAVDGKLQLPFSIQTQDEEALTIASYRLETGSPSDGDYAVPPNKVTDVRMPAPKTLAAMHLDPGGRFLIEAKVNGKGPFLFILDTGGHAIVTPEFAAQHGLAAVGGGISYGSGEGSTPTKYTKVASFRLGGAEMVDQPFLIMPFPYSMLDRGKKAPIVGILGLEVFDRFTVRIDYDANTIELSPAGEPPSTTGTRVPLEFTLDMPMIKAKLDGQEGMFGIDTGNSGDVVIFGEWATKNGLADRYRAGMPLTSFGAGGESVNYLARAQGMEIQGLVIQELLARLALDKGGAFAATGEAGNIGQTVFPRFNITFDYRAKTMQLEPRKAPKIWPAPRAGFGAGKAKADAFRIHTVVKDGPAAAAGLKVGDSFVAIDGVPAERLSSADLYQKVRQAPGTKVRLAVQRDGKRQDVTLTLRELVP